jgi:hypothetical protein
MISFGMWCTRVASSSREARGAGTEETSGLAGGAVDAAGGAAERGALLTPGADGTSRFREATQWWKPSRWFALMKCRS